MKKAILMIPAILIMMAGCESFEPFEQPPNLSITNAYKDGWVVVRDGIGVGGLIAHEYLPLGATIELRDLPVGEYSGTSMYIVRLYRCSETNLIVPIRTDRKVFYVFLTKVNMYCSVKFQEGYSEPSYLYR